jgi:hypothetical protein
MAIVGKSGALSAAVEQFPLTVRRLDRPAHGLTIAAVHRLRSLVEQRGRAAFDVGDLLVEVYGPPSRAGVMDGSRRRLEDLADVLGCSASWLTACRICSAAWPPRHRRSSVGWPVFRALSARPGRIVILDHFVEHCRQHKVTPSVQRLTAFLDTDARSGTRPGRPRLDPVDRLARQALTLDRDALARLVARLTEALTADTAA